MALAFAAGVVCADPVRSGFLSRNWTAEDGLPGSVVRSLVQSSDGFLWVATAEGIARFDGLEFDPLDLPAETEWSRMGPHRLFATRGGVVWFSGYGGGLLRIADGSARQVMEDISRAGDNRVTQVLEEPSVGILVRRGDQIWLVDDAGNARPEPDPAPAWIDSLNRDRETRARSGRMMPDNLPAPLVDLSGRRWSRTAGSGLRVESRDGTPIPLEQELAADSAAVSEMLEISNGDIWIASAINGLYRLRERRIQILDESDGLQHPAVVAVIEHPDGALWIGNRSGGVDRLWNGKVEHLDFSPEGTGLRRSVAAFHVDRQERLWAAARDGSVFRWNGSAFELLYPKQPLASRIEVIHEDGDGTIWMGGSRGLFRDIDGVLTEVGESEGFPGGNVTAMATDPSGRIWIGTHKGRVYRQHGGRIVPVGSANALSQKRVSAMVVEHENLAWVSTLGAGIFLWNGERWHPFDKDQGLPDSRVTCILQDDDGHLWFGSLGGIFRASRAELIERAENPSAPLHWLRMDRSDGLPTRECIGSARPSGWRLADGRLMFPTARGLVAFHPGEIVRQGTAPQVWIRNIRANGVKLKPGTDAWQAGPGKTHLEISFRALDLEMPDETTYLTRLVPLDSIWRENGKTRSVVYDALAPGEYRFEVMAVSGTGVPGNNAATAAIHIKPFFWQTEWFTAVGTLGVLVIAVGIGWITARRRLKRRIERMRLHHARETERARIARDLHDDLGSRVTELSMIASLGLEEKDPERLAESLGEVSSKSRELVGSLDEIVWAVNPSEDSLRSLTDYLTASAREFLTHAGIALRLDADHPPDGVVVESAVRHSIFLAVREALNNVVKHSRANTVRMSVKWRDPVLDIIIADNGRGLPEEMHHGHGLENFHSRMADCGGTCAITNPESGGTQIHLAIPLAHTLAKRK